MVRISFVASHVVCLEAGWLWLSHPCFPVKPSLNFFSCVNGTLVLAEVQQWDEDSVSGWLNLCGFAECIDIFRGKVT